MEPDAVVGTIPSHALADLLTTIHRSGHGHNTRVFDPRRGDLEGPLARAGVPSTALAAGRSPDDAVVLIHAPRRTEQVVALLRQAGAAEVQAIAIGRQSASSLLAFDSASMARKPRRGGRRRSTVPPSPTTPASPDAGEQAGDLSTE